jgi:Multicopper oxidase
MTLCRQMHHCPAEPYVSRFLLTGFVTVCAQVMHIGANVGRITLAARWGPNLGEYMMHCHNNVHEDDDMFRAFMVCPCPLSCSGWLRRQRQSMDCF